MAITELTRVETDTREKTGTRETRGLAAFFALTFLFTWGIAAILILAPEAVERVFGPIGLTNPLFLLAVYAPAVSGVITVWRIHGRRGIRGFLRRLRMIRMPATGWLLLVGGLTATAYAGAFLNGTAGDTPGFSPWYAALPAIGLAMIAGPVEEVGWRGVALPLLQRRYTPLTSGIIVGLVWAVWHLPAFAMSGTVYGAWSFGPYVAGLVALSVIATSLFNASRGSILVAWLFHFQAMNPLFPDAQPWDNLMVVILAVAVVVFDRRRMLGRGEAVVGLLHPDADEVQHRA